MKLDKDKIREIVRRELDHLHGTTAYRLDSLKKKGHKFSNYRSTYTKDWVSVPLWDRRSWESSSDWLYKMYIHIPKEVAEKVMVFEFLPDLGSDSLEKVPRRIH